MNNRQRAAEKARREMGAVLYVRLTNAHGPASHVPLRFLVPAERRAFLARAVSPL